ATVFAVTTQVLGSGGQSLTWTNDLLNSSSAAYQNISQSICDQLIQSLQASSTYDPSVTISCSLTSLQPGSVQATVQLVFIPTNSSSSTYANTSSLQQAIQEGTTTLISNGTITSSVFNTAALNIAIAQMPLITTTIAPMTTTNNGSVQINFEVQAKLLLNGVEMLWNNSFSNQQSTAYTSTANSYCNFVCSDLIMCTVVGYRPGSVYATSDLTFVGPYALEMNEEMLRNILLTGSRNYFNYFSPNSTVQDEVITLDPRTPLVIKTMTNPLSCAIGQQTCDVNARCIDNPAFGYVCQCNYMYEDALYSKAPGTNCIFSRSVIAASAIGGGILAILLFVALGICIWQRSSRYNPRRPMSGRFSSF
ncbi:hypothetical protein Ciccas_009164, partial [Cichlidogyrus casuarinus]